MSACIYHDAEAVAVCPGCDFGVCQQCMDEGSEGICSTCAEERDMRRQHSALQREYSAEEQVARCNYCRAAADEETPLDQHGYCPTCTTLARCCLHDDLIAVGHCKSCRKEYCRKCLGFTDVCQSCTAKNKAKPAKPPTAPVGARPPAKKKAAGTTPIKESTAKLKSGTGPIKEGTSRKSGSAPLKTEAAVAKGGKGAKGGKAATEELDANGKKKKRPPSRGQMAMEARLAAKAPPPQRTRVMLMASVGAVLCIVALSGMFLHASSPDDQARKINDQMMAVQKAIMHYYKSNGRMPRSSEQVRSALVELGVKNANNIRIAPRPRGGPNATGEPNAVVVDVSNSTFMVMGTDGTGVLLKDPHGTPISLDQTFDSRNP